MVGRRAALTTSLLLGLTATPAWAQRVHWNDPGPLGTGQPATLELVFEDCSPEGEVQLPSVPGLELLGSPSESRQFTMLNFRSSSSTTLSYPVRAAQEGSLQIPAFEVETSAGRETVEALELSAGEPRVGQGGPTLEELVSARLRVEQRRPYAGEVFPVELELTARSGSQVRRIATPHWEGPGVAIEPFGQRGVEPSRAAGRTYHFTTLAMVPAAGAKRLPSAQVDLELMTGRRTGLFFNEVVPVQVHSDAPELEVRPLPEAAPEGFAGAVGNFAFDSLIVPETVRVGEPVTWTLRLSGEGNWPAGIGLPAREVPRDLRVVQPRSERHFEEGDLFQGSVSEDLVLIPTRAGDLSLPPVRFVYFDPHEERYRELRVAPPVVHVEPAPAQPAPGAQAPAPAEGRQAPPGPGAPRTPAAPPGSSDTDLRRLPGAEDAPLLPSPELVAGGGRAPSPASARIARGAALLPVAALLLFWLWLSLRRAAFLDPGRPRREARRELERRIRDVEQASRSAADCAQALLAWEHTAKRALGQEVGAGAPGFPRAAAAAALPPVGEEGLEHWAALWSEAHAVIYGGAELAAGWCARARAAAQALRPPRFKPLRALELRHLLARSSAAALLVLLCAGFPPGAVRAEAERDPAAGEDPLAAAYRSGELERAGQGFQRRAELDPQDWAARANLGLVRGQQGESALALAHTAAAFVRAPREPALRWNLRIFAARMGEVDPALRALALGEGAAGLARLLSPAAWQLALVAGSALACFGAGAWLARRFRGGAAQPRLPLAAMALTPGLALAAIAALALSSYGWLADPQAALLVEQTPLRSIPTEARSEGLSRPLPPGSALCVRGAFLGWRRVERPNGEQGWLRAEALVPLYGPLTAPAGSSPTDAPDGSRRAGGPARTGPPPHA